MHPTKEVIATWPKPNFVDPITRGPALTIVNIIFIILVFVVVALRYYTRIKITRSFGHDDIVIGLSLIPTFALTVVVLTADNNFGWNRHSWDLHPEKGPPGYKLCISAQILFFWAATLNKMSLLCFYKRLAGPASPRWYQMSVWGGLIFHAAMLTAFFIVAVCACRPLKAFWSPLATFKYTCIDEGNYMMSFSVITIFLDFILLLLPLPIVWALQLSLKQRIAVCGLFFLGFIVCIAGIIQAYYVDKALIHSYDETWTGWPLWIASAIEVDLGILCVSIPAIRPLLAIYLPRLLESSRPPVRELKEIPEPNSDSELSDSLPSAQPMQVQEKQGSDFFSATHRVQEKDVERGGSGSSNGKGTFGLHN